MRFPFKFRQIELQFRFNTAPNAIRELEPETPEEHKERINRKPNGFKVMEIPEKCDLTSLVANLEIEGYFLLDAFFQKRSDDSIFHLEKTYYMVRFVFTHNHFPIPSNYSDSPYCDVYRMVARNELLQICKSGIYQANIFSNPFFENEKEVCGIRTLNINFKSRESLFYPNGKPVMKWEFDRKIPLKGKYLLQMVNNSLFVTIKNTIE